MNETLQAMPRRILEKLTASTGPVNRWDLADMCRPNAPTAEQAVRMHIRTIRSQLGYDAIKSVWGYGYLLTERGRQAVLERAA